MNIRFYEIGEKLPPANTNVIVVYQNEYGVIEAKTTRFTHLYIAPNGDIWTHPVSGSRLELTDSDGLTWQPTSTALWAETRQF